MEYDSNPTASWCYMRILTWQILKNLPDASL
jgi:hypothetical protein